MESARIKISDILNIENSYITLLARFRNGVNAYGIVYMPPGSNKPVQLFSSEFAFLYTTLVADFRIGFTTGAIVGLARERTPADLWRSDTLERGVRDQNSIYRGILRIIDEEDGIPVFIPSISIVGNIAPALAYFHRGNPLEIQRTLDRYNSIQKSIVAKIVEGKPRPSGDVPRPFDLTGESLKTINRTKSIARALDALTPSPGAEGHKSSGVPVPPPLPLSGATEAIRPRP